MKKHTIMIRVLVLLLLTGCASVVPLEEEGEDRPIVYSILGGIHDGGIVENTDMTLIPEAPPDAVTGATRTGFHAGGRVAVPVGKHAVETGLDGALNRQTFSFNDVKNGYVGDRTITSFQWMVPLTWNFQFRQRKSPDPWLSLKAGAVLQFNMLNNVSDQNSGLPPCSFSRFSGGATLGLSVIPFRLSGGHQLGFYLEGYRGGSFYNDFYNHPELETTGSSYGRVGVVLRINPRRSL